MRIIHKSKGIFSYKKICQFIVILSSFLTTAPLAQANDVDVQKIAQSPFLVNTQISPDGRFLMARVADDPMRVFSVFRLKNNQLAPLLQVRDQINEKTQASVVVDWARWVNEDTIVLRISRTGGGTVYATVDGKREKYARQYATSLFVFNVPERREDATPMWLLSEHGTLISTLPKDPDHILVQDDSRRSTPAVYKINIRKKSKPITVQNSLQRITSWISDRNGNIRGGWGIDRRGKTILKMRSSGAKEYTDYSNLVDDVDRRFEPLGFAENLNIAYAISNHETDTLALYKFDLNSGKFIDQIHHNPDYDVSGIMQHGDTGSLQGVTVTSGRDDTVWVDRELQQEISSLEDSFPGKQVFLSSVTETAKFAMINVSAPNFPGQLYIYDRKNRRLTELPEQYYKLTENDLGHQVKVNYTTRDGVNIPGFLTLPVGIKNLASLNKSKFIIMPHGGPAARDFSGFDPWAQFYAMQGYAVLQMNFRGSTGFGLKFELAGRQEWGQLMQDDISDGVNWLIQKDYANPEKIAIVGASYGGYAALMGAIKTPQLYQCAISFAGVTDLFDLLQGATKNSYLTRLIGNRFSQNDELRDTSPLHRAKDVAIPVQLIHGRLDPIVPFEHSEKLNRRLRDENKNVEFVVLPKSGHGTNDYNDRVKFYEEQKRYINNCL